MFAVPPAPTAAVDDARSRQSSHIMPATLALLLGTLVIGIAGFSHVDLVHNAAHDTRHSNGFPCH